MAFLTSLITAAMALCDNTTSKMYNMPAETEVHEGTIMAWPTEYSILDETYSYPGSVVSETRREVANIAKAIAKYEPLHLFVSDPNFTGAHYGTGDTSLRTSKHLMGGAKNVTIHVTPNVHSLWARDSGPVFVRSKTGPVNITYGPSDDPGIGLQRKATSSNVVGVSLGFNNWGKKNVPNPDFFFACTASQILNKSSVLAPFVAEGGAIEVDGEGTMLATESSIINPNRNPGIDKPTIEHYLRNTLGVDKVIWIPGTRGGDITDDHIDALARFTAPGTVLLSKAFVPDGADEEDILSDYLAAKRILLSSTDARGRPLNVVDVPEPNPQEVLGKEYHPDSGPTVSYVNYLVVNGGVVVAKFGDEEKDTEAARIIGEQYPGRTVEQVYLHQLAVQGGGIHCATQQIVA